MTTERTDVNSDSVVNTLSISYAKKGFVNACNIVLLKTE